MKKQETESLPPKRCEDKGKSALQNLKWNVKVGICAQSTILMMTQHNTWEIAKWSGERKLTKKIIWFHQIQNPSRNKSPIYIEIHANSQILNRNRTITTTSTELEWKRYWSRNSNFLFEQLQPSYNTSNLPNKQQKSIHQVTKETL